MDSTLGDNLEDLVEVDVLEEEEDEEVAEEEREVCEESRRRVSMPGGAQHRTDRSPEQPGPTVAPTPVHLQCHPLTTMQLLF